MNKMTSIKKLVFAAVVAMVGLCGTAWAEAGQTGIAYQDWDSVGKQLTNATCTAYKIVTPEMETLESGWYVVNGEVVVDRNVGFEPGLSLSRPGLKVVGDVHLILCDNASLTLTGNSGAAGLEVSSYLTDETHAITNSLAIYGQVGGTGRLEATCRSGGESYYGAGIGGGGDGTCGTVTVNGGTVIATGGQSGAGIGGGRGGSGGVVTINGGTVTATGGADGAGIGGGQYAWGGVVTVNGGVVTATSGGGESSGIGRGGYVKENVGTDGTVAINGGMVTATGGTGLAGFGTAGISADVTFADNVPFAILTGYEALNEGVSKEGYAERQQDYRHVRIEAGKTVLVIGYAEGLVAAVSNGTSEVEASVSTRWRRTWVFPADETVTVGFSIRDWFEWNGEPAVPRTITMNDSVFLAAEDQPSVRRTRVDVDYYTWDADKKEIVGPFSTNAIVVETTMQAMTSDWYVVHHDVTNEMGGMLVDGDAHLILCDEAKLVVTGRDDLAGLSVVVFKAFDDGMVTNSLVIYGQLNGTGVLETTGASDGAGIGGLDENEDCGVLTVNGGTVIATGGQSGAGIGGGRGGSGGVVTINGGTVTALGGEEGAGIGSGEGGDDGGTVTINGGTVKILGGDGCAGIGSCEEGVAAGTVTISGGTVTARGGMGAAGIGGGYLGAGGVVTISGGTVSISGGTVKAVSRGEEGGVVGGCGAGIGSGCDGAGGEVTISGGDVTAISYPADIPGKGVFRGEGIGVGAAIESTAPLAPGSLNLDGYAGVKIFAGMDTNGVEVAEVQAADYATEWHTNLYVHIQNGDAPAATIQKLNFTLQAFKANYFGTVTMADGETLGEDEIWVWACLGLCLDEGAKSAWANLNALVGKTVGTDNLLQVTNGLDAASFGTSATSPFGINTDINQKTVVLVRAAKADGTIRAIGGVKNAGKLEADRTHENEMLGEGLVSVAYYAWDSEAKKLVLQPEVQAIQVTDTTTALEADKWYLVSGDWTFDQNIAVSGSAHLILCPYTGVKLPNLGIAANATLSVYTMWNPDEQYSADYELGILNCNGVQAGAGAKLNVQGCVVYWGGMHFDTINVYGGMVDAVGDNSPAIRVDTALNVFGGVVDANCGGDNSGIVGRSDAAGAAVNVDGGLILAVGGVDMPGIDVGTGASQVSLTLGEGVRVWVSNSSSGEKSEAPNYAESRERYVWVTAGDLVRAQDFTVSRYESTFRVTMPNEPGDGYCWAVITLPTAVTTYNGTGEALIVYMNKMLQGRSLLSGLDTPFATLTMTLDRMKVPNYSVEYHTGKTFDLNDVNADLMVLCRVADNGWRGVYTMGGTTGLQALTGEETKENVLDDGLEPEPPAPETVEATYYAWNGTEVAGPLTTNAIPVTADMTTLESGWYVVQGQVVIDRTEDDKPGLVVNGDVHLILADDAELNVNGGEYAGICVNVVESGATNSISIYGQENNTGKLIAIGGRDGAGIGAQDTEKVHLPGHNFLPIDCGVITIHGGDISARSSEGSGIGSFGYEDYCGNYGGTITIYGGMVNAVGGTYGASIGSSGWTSDPDGYGDAPSCRVTIYGGEITAGSMEDMSITGIGGGMGRNGGIVTIYGGTVEACGVQGAGIGGGMDGTGGTVMIHGGNVEALSIMGAGIGGGALGAGGMVTINGGTVNAVALSVVGGDEEDPVIYPAGAGIGGGLMGVGGMVTINGGEVTAISYPVDMGGGTIVQGEGIGAGANMADPTTPLDPGTFDLSGYTGTHYVYAGMDTNGDEVTDVTNEDFANWHGYCYVQITQTPRGGPAAPAAVKIVSAKSARTEGAWSGAAEVVYELSNLKADGRYALAFELTAAGQFGARTNEVEAVVDGVYTQELFCAEFFGIESQVQDPAAKLELKLIEKSKAAK